MPAMHSWWLCVLRWWCGGAGAQVPFIGWAAAVAAPVGGLLQKLSVPTASLLFKRTGMQFFLAGAGRGGRHMGDERCGAMVPW